MNAHDPFGQCKPLNMTDLGLDREARVQLIGEAAQALLDGRMPADAARIFLASSLTAWLARGGNLEREYFKVTKAKSHHTPAALWRQILAAHPDERHATESDAQSEHHQLQGTLK